MYVLRIEHPVRDYAGWKAAFDNDPVGRKTSGVRRHRILHPADDSHVVVIELEFDTKAQAQSLRSTLRILWNRGSEDGGHNGILRLFPEHRTVIIVMSNSGERGTET
jgi:hypothetical protein